MATTTRILLLLFTSIFFLFTLFCFTPFSHFSSPIVAKALSFFHHNADDAEAEAVSSISVDQHHGQSIISPAVDEKDVVVLTKNNFSDFVNRNQYVMLNFYAPWSYWSQKLAPEYAAAATMLKGKVVLAKIDATQETELARKFNIRGYSTVYLSVGGVRKGPHSEELAAVSKLHIDVKFYQTSNVDVAVLFHIDPQIKRPALIMRKRECVKYSHFDYEEDASNIFENPMKKLWLFTPPRSWKVVCIFKEAANAFKGKLLFVHVEIGDELSAGRRLSHEFGLTEGSPTSFAEEFMEDKFLIKAEPAVKTVIRLPLHSHASDPSSIPPAY
ncbi:hypothetical protein GH714_033962 [Hevea brasiliensis]|uniref:Thioredoxin domain-containing protein n=1 Tax=Hevea brasiliensis TaxID=3981 RepID=A0A6A6L477_HEVBR|nr:hypothetical protein GH714_033962 [Hevea brasiliensis]